MLNQFIILPELDQDVQQIDISAGTGNNTTAFAADFLLSAIFVNRIGSGGNADFDIFFNSGTTGANNTLIHREALGNDEDYVYQPPSPLYFKSGDEVRYAFPNLGGAGRTLNVTVTVLKI